MVFIGLLMVLVFVQTINHDVIRSNKHERLMWSGINVLILKLIFITMVKIFVTLLFRKCPNFCCL